MYDRVGACRQRPEDNTSEIAEWVIRLLGAVIIVGGVPCNLAAAYIQGTERSNRVTTRFLMVCLALSDSGVLLLAVVRYWIRETFNIDLRDLHPFICRFHQPVVATVSDVAVYTLCAIGVERFVVVAFPYRVQQILTTRNFSLSFGAMVLALLVKNMPLSFFLHTSKCYRLLNSSLTEQNETDLAEMEAGIDYQLVDKCDYNQDFAKFFINLDMVTYLILPYTILLFCNIYIYTAMRRQSAAMRRHAQPTATNQRADKGKAADQEVLNPKRQGASAGNAASNVEKKREAARRKPESIMKILAVLTVIHIITTLPASIAQKLKVYGDKNSISGATNNALKTLMFANNATNFLAYFISSTAFRRRVMNACPWRRSSNGSSVNGDGKKARRRQQGSPEAEQSAELPMLRMTTTAAKAAPSTEVADRDSREVVAALISAEVPAMEDD